MLQGINNFNQIGSQMGRVGQLMNPNAFRTSLRPVFSQADSFQIASPEQIRGIPATSNRFGSGFQKSPMQQLTELGQKYNIPYTGDINSFQKKVVKALVMHKALEYGVPLTLALGIAGNESGWKMWKDINNGVPVQGKNIRNGVLKSTDWGVMQINDKAHPKAFPQVKNDLIANVEYGMKFLSGRHDKIKGSLGLGFGAWDRTIASYNLGHNPKDAHGYSIAQRYVSNVKKRSMQA